MHFTLVLALWACGVPPTPDAPAADGPAAHAGKRSDIDIEGFATAHAAGVSLIDVRTAGEFAGGHVAGAVNLPVGDLAPDRPLEGFDKAESLYVICASGGRSSRAADMLAQRGWTVINIEGGTRGWIAAGHPVE